MKKRWLILFILAIAAGSWFLTSEVSQDAESETWREFSVTQQSVRDVLREVGELAPQDPVLIQAPFNGDLKWLVQDGTWVQAGEKVLEFDEELLVERVSELRADVIDKRQELRMAKLQAEQTRIAERQDVESAKQNLKLAEIRHRILTSTPVGGDQLVTLDKEIQPLEKRLNQLQAELEPLDAAFRASRKVYQDALNTWQEARASLLEVRMGGNLADSKPTGGMAKAGGGKFGPGSPKIGKKGEKSRSGAPVASTVASTGAAVGQASSNSNAVLTVEAATEAANATKQILDQTRAAHEKDRLPYEAKLAEIHAVDEEAEELYIQIEIEKRGLPATTLRIDTEIAKLQLAEAERQVESGKRALAAGAMSKLRCDQLIADAEAAAGRLEILEYRLEIASRPATEDEVATSEATLNAARRAVENAEEIFEREMQILVGEQATIEARLQASIGELNRSGKGFPTAIEGTMRMLKAEAELLEPEEKERATEIERELALLEAELVEAKLSPPNIVLAPSSGLVRLRENDDRLTDIGDNWSRGSTVAMLYPPGKMDVKLGINEANFQRVKPGMPCLVRIPALDMEIENASVAHVSQIGRDRIQTKSRWVTSQLSGITEFALSVNLGREVEDFRQGMTVLLDIVTDEVEDALVLPAAAILGPASEGETQDGFLVLRSEDPADTATVRGRYFGDDWFIVESGLDEGAKVYRSYPGAKQ